ncbi:(p)ppGpp synthetase I SpoT/RelA [Thermincola ferriacetica]|uniref:GTP diphosphokinase n=2 Tax=Thermincola TaxID=278993 RepID=D5XEJ9_THEPJ|nr:MULTISPECIES: bifunctional (p)ppGpp synthetase/guanosine-3',5'-bis(diphosphate) 3'-pyrophosphohydrolase [Thermincola]ADG82070.1 (p)ppGpp synthetase I, SpoT/RelA [Thermincola potens JR]KNZ71088.1 (p)ppGpp synthetase I SpoT/RelA [Thermincola ferriacetica]
MGLDKLLAKIKQYNPQVDEKFIEETYRFAEKAHEGQTRISGEPYIIHPLSVAHILADLELDVVTIAAGLLHDVVEDTDSPLETIEEKFGVEIALLVDGVTKLSRISYKNKMEQQVENLRKMFLAMAKDIRVILIKLADRLHNMRTLKHLAEPKQKEISEETLEIFAPLAHRLGIFKIKWELEDLALRYLEPKKYYELVDGIAQKRAEREEYIARVTQILAEKLENVGIKADIQGRPKHFYSIYKKMLEQQKELAEIYDLLAVRVIVDTVKDCYGALGIIHTLWKPIPGRFKDYIAMPKSNMYQSLHTTVIGPNGEPFEIQIRTWEMHRTAEYGIAAHWRYKEGGGRGDEEFENKLAWLRQLLEWQNDMRDAREFMETLKIDLFSDAVFVFTPKGDVVELPAGAIPIDFAYRIHTQVGHRCIGAKVNGKIVPLDYKLANGDIVEILTQKQAAGPSRDWLNIVKTSEARSKIRAWFKKEKREENIIKGRDALEKEVKKAGYDVAEFLKPERLSELPRKFNLVTLDDLYASLGNGVFTPQQVIAKLKDEQQKQGKNVKIEELLKKEHSKKKKASSQGIKVEGQQDVMIRLARCCNPVPGDPIIGYITRGRGVSVHRKDCRNLVNHSLSEGERMIQVSWDDTDRGSYHVHLEISAMDRAGLLTDVMLILSEMRISADWVNARGTKNKQATIDLVLEIGSLEQLENIMSKIRRVKDVYDVWRVTPKV